LLLLSLRNHNPYQQHVHTSLHYIDIITFSEHFFNIEFILVVVYLENIQDVNGVREKQSTSKQTSVEASKQSTGASTIPGGIPKAQNIPSVGTSSSSFDPLPRVKSAPPNMTDQIKAGITPPPFKSNAVLPPSQSVQVQKEVPSAQQRQSSSIQQVHSLFCCYCDDVESQSSSFSNTHILSFVLVIHTGTSFNQNVLTNSSISNIDDNNNNTTINSTCS
jgi:hypothetical protein